MQIGKLNLGQLMSPVFGSSAEQSAPAAGEVPTTKKASGNDPGLAQVATYREILSKYDVTQITPGQFSQLIRELHSAGAVDDDEMRELASVRFELDRSGVKADDEVNLVELFATRLERLRNDETDAATGREVSEQTPDERRQSITLAERQLEWLQKFAAVHADTARDGLNTLA